VSVSVAALDIGGRTIDAARMEALCVRYGIVELAVFGSPVWGSRLTRSKMSSRISLVGVSTWLRERQCTLCCARPSSSKPGSSTRRDGVLLAEVIEACERIVSLVADRSASDFGDDLDRRDALLWNFTVLGEAVGQLSDDIKHDHPEVGWASPVRMRNRIVHGY